MEGHIVGIGEILWDMLPDGKKLGGAPANFAYHCRQFGYDGVAVSAVGKDSLAEEIYQELEKNSLPGFLEEVDYPTGTVKVTLDSAGVPCYEITKNVAYDFIAWTPQLEELAKHTRAVCFGTLSQRNDVSRMAISTFLDSMPSDGTLKIYDINLRQNFYSKEIIDDSLKSCNIFKVNDEELPVVCDLFGIKETEPVEACREMMRRYDLLMVILTCGAVGSYVVSEHETSYIDTPKVEIADTVGAGDSFTATMCSSILSGLPIADAHRLAVDVSAYVCSQHGAMPVIPEEYLARLKSVHC